MVELVLNALQEIGEAYIGREFSQEDRNREKELQAEKRPAGFYDLLGAMYISGESEKAARNLGWS